MVFPCNVPYPSKLFFFLTIQGKLTDYCQSLDLGKNSRGKASRGNRTRIQLIPIISMNSLNATANIINKRPRGGAASAGCLWPFVLEGPFRRHRVSVWLRIFHQGCSLTDDSVVR